MANDASSSFELGKMLFDENKSIEAIPHLREAVNQSPDNAEYHAWLAVALNANEINEEAIKEAETAIKLDPTNTMGRRALGYIFTRIQKFPEAIRYFLQAIEIDPNDFRAYNGIAMTYQAQKDYTNATKYIAIAIDIDPKSTDTLITAGDIYWDAKSWRDYYIVQARKYELGSSSPWWNTDDRSDPKRRRRIEAVNNHYKKVMSPNLKNQGEKVIGYWPMTLIVWDRESTNRMINGTSWPMEYGKIGTGFVVLTDHYLRIIILGDESKLLKPSGLGKLARVFMPVREQFEVPAKDQQWKVAIDNITDCQNVVDNYFEEKSVLIVSSDGKFYLYPDFSTNDRFSSAIKEAMAGKFSDIWANMNVKPTVDKGENIDQGDVITRLKELINLKESGYLTEIEFTEAKKKLLGL